MINITGLVETGDNQIDCAERGYVHQEAKASETHQPLKAMINNNLVRNQVKANWEDITRKGEDHAMTYELENKVPSIYPQATNWLDNNDSKLNFNLTKTPSLVNGGWKENYGNQLLDSNLLDPIKNPSLIASNRIDIDIRMPDIHLIEPLDVDLVEPINPDAAFLTDVADRHIGMADAAMERMWGSMMAGISSAVGDTTESWNADSGTSYITETESGWIESTRSTDGEYNFYRINVWGIVEISEEEYVEEYIESQSASGQSSTNSSSSSSSSSRDDSESIAPWTEWGGKPPIWMLEQSPEMTDHLDSLINQINPHLTSEYLLKEVVTTSLENRIKDNVLLQGKNTSAQIEGTDELTNFDKGLLANSVATSLEHSPGFEDPIAADHDVFSFGGMTQSMPSSPADENVLLTLDNVMPQQMVSNNMATVF